jgi:hypothetical protein
MSVKRFPAGLQHGVPGGTIVHECEWSRPCARRGFMPGCTVRPQLFDDDRDGPPPPVGLIVGHDDRGFHVLWGPH